MYKDITKLSILIFEMSSSSILSLEKECTIPETMIMKVNISSKNPFSIHLKPNEPIIFSVLGGVKIESKDKTFILIKTSNLSVNSR